MKTLMKIASFGAILFGIAQPHQAKAASFSCVPYTISGLGSTVWPNVNGSYLNCQETSDPNGSSNAANVASYINLPNQAALLKQYKVKFYIFTTPQDMLAQIVPSPAVTIDANNSGYSFVDGSGNVTGVPASTIYTKNINGVQWSTTVLVGSARHELGHQMDRIWAEVAKLKPGKGYSEATIASSDTLYLKAQSYDEYNLAQNPTALHAWQTTYASLNHGNELIAELFAGTYGSGSDPAATNFVVTNFPCAFNYVLYYQQNNVAPPNLTVNNGFQENCLDK